MICSKIIARIKGGLGNQLFSYAAARRLSIVNGAELVIDDITGFARDRQYYRRYMLDHFQISARKATPAERLEPFDRLRRALLKFWWRRKPFAERRYLEQEGTDFDKRLLAVRVAGTIFLDGLWQSESYFKDIEDIIRKDLRIVAPDDTVNRRVAREIQSSLSVAVHVRWFDSPGSTELHNVSNDYYKLAIAIMERRIELPHYFLFSDDPEASRLKLSLPEGRVTSVSHNRGDENAYADLWLMTQCRHFIIANSTFSWWGAWLSGEKEKIVVCPEINIPEGKTAWNFSGQVPSQWLRL